MTINIGQRAGSTIAPVSSYTKRTKELTTVSITASTSVSNVTGVVSKCFFYADSAGIWRMSGTIKFVADLATTSAWYVTIDNVVFYSSTKFYQSIGGYVDDTDFIAKAITTVAVPNEARIIMLSTSTTTGETGRDISLTFCDVLLNAEPTTYTTAANMENVQNISAYFPPVSSGVAGIFPALNTELDNVTATRLGLKQYLHGTTYNGGNAPTVTYTFGGGTLSAVNRAVFIPYQSQDGTWRLRFNGNITLSSASRTEVQFTINGVTSIALYQAIPGSAGDGTNPYLIAAAVKPSSGVVDIACASATTTIYYFAGDIELASKPTWAY